MLLTHLESQSARGSDCEVDIGGENIWKVNTFHSLIFVDQVKSTEFMAVILSQASCTSNNTANSLVIIGMMLFGS